jgi:hypothetical protein
MRIGSDRSRSRREAKRESASFVKRVVSVNDWGGEAFADCFESGRGGKR